MARYRRRRRRIPLLPILVALVPVSWAAHWYWSGASGPLNESQTTGPRRPALVSDRPEVAPGGSPREGVTEKGANPAPTPKVPETAGEKPEVRVDSLIRAARQALSRDDGIAARTHLSEAIGMGAVGDDALFVRAELTRIGNETIFSPRIFENDPLVTRYTIQTGDSLGKIAKANKVTPELLAAINHIPNVNLIRAGQVIKVIKGPFSARVSKTGYALDVYLGNTFVKHFKVGLGADGSTPTGEWRVSTRLKNPTYYPPRGGDIIGPDDPQNPLGERWIALEGISGMALGQQRYGIHGTIEPESIGKDVSLGCIRMYNEDVALLYTYLVEKHSTVTVVK